MSTRTRAAALAPGLLLALALYAGEAAAQNVCRGGPYTGADGGNIVCEETSGSADIVIDPGSVNVALIDANHRGSGDITVRMTAGALTGSGSYSILAQRRGSGDASIDVSGGSLTNTVLGSTGNTATGDVSISMSGGSLSGRLAISRNGGTGNGYVTVSGDATIKETQAGVFGAGAASTGLGDEISVRMMGGSVETTGANSAGLFLRSSNNNGAAAAAMTAVIEGGSVRTRGSSSSGVWFASFRGSRDASFRMTGGSIVAEADDSAGVYFGLNRFATGQTASVRMTGGSIVAEGLGSRGLSAPTLNLGSLDAMTGAGAEIAAPFAVGMEGLLEVDASETGRLVFAHGGAVSARDVGVLAWARRSSGHTMGAGATTADDAARTMPMIHVTSSGDVTVGAPVTDAFIRARITGEDGTLSTAEQAVLSAITAGDSDALTTALAALPDADYDADWKAEAEDLRRKRAASSAAPTGNGPLAQQAGEEILGLSRAGVRAYALSHTAIVDHVRAGNALSTEERAALDAVLTKGAGSELETALTALTGATYTAAWKDTVRRFAATYNAGDVRVDVTGGTIAAEGNGVEALYAVRHDSNGAIAVSVAEGARVTGGAHGIHVRGAGATGGVRNQSVTVNGRVMGGTGAGVYLGGGGTVSVGATGEVGATSGDGILADGGDLRATVSGTVTGDVRVNGGGDLTANVLSGGVVTGTVHDPQASFTVGNGASIGRLRYTSGATVTVSGGGKLTGDEGVAVESTTGPLSVTVNDEGRVEGDVKSGGTLTANVMSGGVVTGTIHDPQASFTVGNGASIGRLLYTSGGTVTVAGGGKLTGVEGVAAESTAGALSVTVNDEGRVEGDVKSGGTLTANVMSGGVVTGTIHDPQASFTVGSGASIGRLLYTSGGTVTVAGGGKLTGVEGVAAESTAGALSVTVNDEGRVEGDVKSGGTLTANVMSGGVVTGTLHDPQASFTVGSGASIGRLLYTGGGTVTVAGGGKLTGVEGVAAESTAGALSVTVNDEGRVEGDVKSGGTLTANVMSGGVVTGTLHDPQASFTVGSGASIGRLLYTGGGTVTVAGGGKLTGVEGVAAESTAGALSVTVNDEGRVEGDLESGGTLTANVMSGGVVTGTLHDPQASFTVGSGASIGRLLYTSGGTVTVAGGGKLTGVEGVAAESTAGALSVTVNDEGRVEGDVKSGGTLTANVMSGGVVTGTIHDPQASFTVGNGASIGRLLYTSGGTVTVAATGRLTGVEVDGRTEALRSEAGDLDLTVAGRVTGDVFGLGAGEHTVTVSNGGTVTGTVHLAASTVTVHGRAGRVRFDKGGTVTVGSTGWITGIEDAGRTEAIRNEAGDLVVSVAGRITGDIIDLGARPATVTVEAGGTVTGTVRSEAGELVVVIRQAAGETGAAAAGRVPGRIEEKGGRPQVLFQRAGEAEAMPVGGAPGTRSSVPVGAFDVGIVTDGGGVWLAHRYAPRSKVYEALPSVVLGLNRVSDFRERMAAPRTANGGWARVETFRGKWKADESTTAGLEYDHRRHGLKAGLDATVGEAGLFGVSFHHRQGSAEVPNGGEIDLSGNGVGVSGTWAGDAGVYVDVQAEATWYEADLSATGRGVLKTGVPGRGHALGVEVGRRVAVERLPAGMVLTPRAGLAHSRVSMGGFTDRVDARVSVEDGRSLKGRAGMAVEMEPGGASGSRVFGTVDVEHEFSRDTKVVVSGTELKSEAEATWLRLGLNGVHAWDEGRSTVQGGVSYATGGGGHELGGGVSLSVRF